MKTLLLILLCSIFVIKESSGQRPEVIWAKSYSANENVYPVSTSIDMDGNIITVGYFEGTADFDPGVGSFSLTSAGYWDIFIQKLKPNGEFLWAKQIGGRYSEYSGDMEVDNSGNIYLTGTFSDPCDFDPGPAVHNVKTNGANDIFIAKYSSSGSLLWVVPLGEEVSDDGTSITIDKAGNVLVTGWFQGKVDFDPGPGEFFMTSWGPDCFILKLSSAGSFIWAKMIGSYGWVEGHTIKTDTANNVYVAGLFRLETDFNPGPGEFKMTPKTDMAAFLVKLNKNGDFKWAIQPGSTAVQTNFGKKRPMVIDKTGNVILAFKFRDTVDFDPGQDEKKLTSKGWNDIFIQKIDTAGKLLWVNQIGGTYVDEPMTINTDLSDNLLVTGLFSGTVDFDPGDGTFNMTAGGDFDNSIFAAKFDKDGKLLWGYSTLKPENNWPYGVGRDIFADQSGNVIVVGEFSGTFDFNPGRTPVILTSPIEKHSGFIVKLRRQATKRTMSEKSIIYSLTPNPFQNKVYLYSDHQVNSLNVSVYSITGQKVKSFTNLAGNYIELDLTNIPSGIYLVKMNEHHHQFVSKIIKY